MPLRKVTGDVLAARADALVVAVDGEHPRMIGAIANKLQARIDDEVAWSQVIEDARFPIPAGEARLVELEELPGLGFGHVVFAAMFTHRDRRLFLEAGYASALACVRARGLRTVATALYFGGWRGTPEAGLAALERACARYPTLDVALYQLPSRDAG